jgi:plasmid maintenance system antidote protein VapI
MSFANLKSKIQEAYSFDDDKEKLGFEADSVQLRIMSQVESLMKSQNITRKELAEKMSVTPAHITHLFTADRNINTKMLAKFQRAFGVKFEAIFTVKNSSKIADFSKSSFGERYKNTKASEPSKAFNNHIGFFELNVHSGMTEAVEEVA